MNNKCGRVLSSGCAYDMDTGASFSYATLSSMEAKISLPQRS